MDIDLNFTVTTHQDGTPHQHDVVSVNGVEFAHITYDRMANVYVTTAIAGSRAGQDLSWKNTHKIGFNDAMSYALKEGLG